MPDCGHGLSLLQQSVTGILTTAKLDGKAGKATCCAARDKLRHASSWRSCQNPVAVNQPHQPQLDTCNMSRRQYRAKCALQLPASLRCLDTDTANHVVPVLLEHSCRAALPVSACVLQPPCLLTNRDSICMRLYLYVTDCIYMFVLTAVSMLTGCAHMHCLLRELLCAAEVRPC